MAATLSSYTAVTDVALTYSRGVGQGHVSDDRCETVESESPNTVT